MGKEKFYEAKINYMNTRNRSLLAELERKDSELQDKDRLINFLMGSMVVIMVLSGLSLLAVWLNG